MKKIPIGRKKHFLIILSALVSVILWIFITYSENPQIDTRINNIPVTLNGEHTLEENGYMVIKKAEIPPASVVIRGRRQDIIGVMGNISASVELAGIDSEGTYKLRPAFSIPSNVVYIAKRITMDIPIEVVRMDEKEVEVKIISENAQNNRSFVVESIPETESVTVRGYSSDIEKISRAAVYIDTGVITKSQRASYDIVFEDENGEKAETENSIGADKMKINVTNTVYDTVTANIELNIPSELPEGIAVSEVSKEFDTVRAGIKDPLAGDTEIIKTLPLAERLTPGTREYTFELDVPEGLYIPEDKRTVTAELEVYEKAEKFVTVPVTVKNTKNRSYTLENETVSILISGPEDKLTADNITAEADIDALSPGEEFVGAFAVISSKEKDIIPETDRVPVRVKIEG